MAGEAILTDIRAGGQRLLRITAGETRCEFLRLLRTRAYSLSIIGLPVMLYVFIGLANRDGHIASYLIASYSCMGAVSASLFGVGLTLSLERAQGWLELKRASPMPPLGYIGAKTLSCAAFALVIALILIGLGATLGGVAVTASQAIRLTGVVLAGSIPFTAMGLLIGILVPPNAAAGIINMIYLPMSFASGFWMPMGILPHWVQALAPALPTYHLAELALAIFGQAPSGTAGLHWAVLAAFTALMLAGAWITFARSESS